MRKILAIVIMGTSFLTCMETNYGVYGNWVLHTKNVKDRHHTELQGGLYGRLNLGNGHSGLLQIGIAPSRPVLSSYYVYHFEQQPVGYYNMIGLTTAGIGFGVGYDFDRNFGLQTTFTTCHNTLSVGAKFAF